LAFVKVEFLELPEPAAPLPRVNDTASFNAMITSTALGKLSAWWSQQAAPAPRA
jgi:hypothetical protein